MGNALTSPNSRWNFAKSANTFGYMRCEKRSSSLGSRLVLAATSAFVSFSFTGAGFTRFGFAVPRTAFTTAGGHLNPDSKQHGLENPMGAHQGDLPEIIVAADGTGHATFPARTTLDTLFDADGAAFVVHAAADDNKTDPTGNSGARILCGVLERMAG